ncbi:MAG: hypothetical protein J7J79_01980 [Thermoplasmata archaeon]|nr:hypothetical protein [Thermoplasmata archaeon]
MDARRLLGALLVGLGVGIWAGWGLTYGVWLDVGLYTVTVIPIAFGLLLLRLSRR